MSPEPKSPSAPPRDRSSLALALVLLLSVGVFTPSLINGFTYDDPHYARTTTPDGRTNPMVAAVQPFWDYWLKPMNWGVSDNCRGYRPVTVYSYALINSWAADPGALGYEQGDDRAWAQHLLNLLLHGLATLGVFLLLRNLSGRVPALLAAAVFGVHALHSDPVASIVGRGELLAFVGGCGAALCYGSALRSVGHRRWSYLGAAGLLTTLALGSKESALAWVAFIPILARVSGHSWRAQSWPALLALALPAAVFLLLRQQMMLTHVEPRGPFWVEHDANPLYYLPTTQRIANATCILLYGLGKTLLPCNLSSNYGDGPFTLVAGMLSPRFLAAGAVLLALLIAALRMRRRQPLLCLAAVAFFGFSFITSNIPLPIETNFGERLYYTPVLGLSLLVAGLAGLLRGRGRLLAGLLLAGWMLWSAQLSVQRSFAWFNNMTLFRTDLRSQPRSVGLHVDMGNLHLWNFDAASGAAAFRRALELNPQSPRALRHVAESAEYPEACALLERALRSPHLVEATEGRRIHWMLGNLHQDAGKPDAAWQSFRRALACNPRVPAIRLHLLRESARRGAWQDFDGLLVEGLELSPGDTHAALYRALQRRRRGEAVDAEQILAGQRPELRAAWTDLLAATSAAGAPR